MYYEEVPVREISIDKPIGGGDEESLTLEDLLGVEEAFNETLDSARLRQQIVFGLPEIEQVEILILKQLGYKYYEIKRLLRLRSTSHYYQIFNRLRRNYLKEFKKLQEK